MRTRLLFAPGLLSGILVLTSCSTLGYYSQAVGGHVDIMMRARPIENVIADDSAPPVVRTKLRRTQEARAFAFRELKLPRTRSYERYADLDRPAVVWNVIATPPLSVHPLEWCYPIAGCFTYRGYFSRAEADRYAEALTRRGFDTHVAGASAYSTLGWFDDPILSTMLRRAEPDVVATLFHEMAHQKLHVDGDSAFNEAFAEAVAEEGVRRFYADDPERFAAYSRKHARMRAVSELLQRTRARLEYLYEEPVGDNEKHARKAAILASVHEEYAALKEQWDGYDGFDDWIPADLNNAHLALTATYHELVPGFLALLAEEGNDLEKFYRHAESLAGLSRAERRAHLASAAQAAQIARRE